MTLGDMIKNYRAEHRLSQDAIRVENGSQQGVYINFGAEHKPING